MTTQDPLPLHAPDQPSKIDPLSGAAVKVTLVPVLNAKSHVAPQSMPLGELVTTPVPLPSLITVD
jgi:hypothetical protein